MSSIQLKLDLPHPAQQKVLDSPARFKVMVCGRRLGKTTLALIQLLVKALETKGIYWYISPSYRQSKNIAWRMLLEMAKAVITSKNEQELLVYLVNGSELHLKGVDNEDALRGVGLDGVICDEYADWKSYVFNTIIRPSLTDRRGWAWFLGTPKGFNHFYDLYLKAKNMEDWDTFHFTSYDNPYLPRNEIEYAKKTTDPKYFAQEYLAEFTSFTGLVYHAFDRNLHVQEFELPSNLLYFRGIDFGADHPTACVFWGVDSSKRIWIYDEYKAVNDFDAHCFAIKEKTGSTHVNATWGDPSAKQAIIEFNKRGVYVSVGVNDRGSERGLGISLINSLFRQNEITIHSKCVNLIYELEHHKFRDHREGMSYKGGDVEKMNDDLLDAFRYSVNSYYAPPAKKDHIQEKLDKLYKKKFKFLTAV